jgi:oxygen-dependent protoporphyrinogen oxidase
MRRVAIIGGGISGLAVAEALGRKADEAGAPVERVVFERDPEPGGKIKSWCQDGFVVEAGPHGFLGREPAVFELIDRMGLKDEVVRADGESARRYLVQDGSLREIPMKPPAFLKANLLSLWGRARLVAEPFIPNEAPEDESVADFATRRLGPEAARVLVDAMVTGIYAGDPHRLSLPAAFPRMRELESEYGSLIRAQFRLAKDRKGETPDAKARRESLHSFQRGLGTLTRKLAELPERIHTGCSVHRVEALRAGGFRLSTGVGTVEADAVVVTVPTFELPHLLAPLDGAQTQVETVAAVDYAPVHVVVHGFRARDVPTPTDGFGFLAPHCEGRNVLGSIWASTVFPVHAPEGMVLFRTLIGGVRARHWGDAKDEAVRAAVRQELSGLIGLPKEVPPVMERIIRWPRGIPQYEVGHLGRVEVADQLETQWPGLYLAGNGLRGVALLDCVRGAGPLADRVLRQMAAPPVARAS